MGLLKPCPLLIDRNVLACAQLLDRTWGHVSLPTLGPHVTLNLLPYGVNNFAITETTCICAWRPRLPPLVHCKALHTVAPIPDIIRGLLAAPANMDAQHVAEQLVGATPLVILELPGLSGCEDGDNAVPVFRLELLHAFNQYKAHWAIWVNVAHRMHHVDHG